MRPFPYEPEEFFSLGRAGEHPITIFAWIDSDVYEGGERRYRVNIVRATASVAYHGFPAQEWDVTGAILNSRALRLRYESEIRAKYLRAREAPSDDHYLEDDIA